MSEWTLVDGEDKGDIQIYALSTCIWCKKTKSLLKDKGIKYQYIDVDLLSADEKQIIKESLGKWNNKITYPTVVINDAVCIVGYKIQELTEELGL